MTVPSEINRNGYLGNGLTTVFAYSFKINAATDLRVVLTDVNGEDTVLVLNTDYTVSGVLSQTGGNVTLTTAPDGDGTDWPNSEILTIRRVLPVTQLLDLRTQGAFSAEVIERAFDRLVMIEQQLKDQLDRSLRVAESEEGSDGLILPMASERAGNGIMFDSNGDIVVGSPADSPVSADMQPVVAAATLALARAAMSVQELNAYLTGLAGITGAAGGSMVYWNNVGAATKIDLTASMKTFLATALSANIATLLGSADFAAARTNLQIFGPTTVTDVSITTTASPTAFNTWHKVGASANYTITLPSVGSGDVGKTMCFRCDGTFDVATRQVSVDPNGSETIFGLAAGDPVVITQGSILILMVTASGKWSVILNTTAAATSGATVQVLTGSGTATIVNGATYEATLVGGGGGGQGGANPPGGAGDGGYAGSPGNRAHVFFVAGSSTIAYSCGAGGAGGGGKSVGNNTAPTAGSAGGATTLGSYTADGGAGGTGADNAGHGGGNGIAGRSGVDSGGAGGAGGTGGDPNGSAGSAAVANTGCGGGGGGGSLSVDWGSSAGGAGAAGFIVLRRVA